MVTQGDGFRQFRWRNRSFGASRRRRFGLPIAVEVTMKRLGSIIGGFVFLLAFSPRARAATCSQALVHDLFLTSSDYAQAHELPRDADLSKKLFSTYMEARLRTSPVTLQIQLARQLEQTQIVFNDESVVQGEALRNAIMVPESLKDSAVVELIRVHELEHLVQIADRGFFKTFLRSKYSAKDVFENEEAAIRAEWEFLQLLPSYLIQNTIREIRAAGLQPEAKKLLLAMFASAHLSRDLYVKNQHEAGRYRAGDVQKRTAENYMKILIGSFAAAEIVVRCATFVIHQLPF